VLEEEAYTTFNPSIGLQVRGWGPNKSKEKLLRQYQRVEREEKIRSRDWRL